VRADLVLLGKPHFPDERLRRCFQLSLHQYSDITVEFTIRWCSLFEGFKRCSDRFNLPFLFDQHFLNHGGSGWWRRVSEVRHFDDFVRLWEFVHRKCVSVSGN
jgi:hypothetical protein